nr:PREDICTED: low-density lipoprotein receptor-related protein 2-like [Bemisia tabaci]
MNNFAALLLIVLVYETYETDASESSTSCSGVKFSALNGTIASPYYPFRAAGNISCDWTISSPTTGDLQINVLDLNINNDGHCDSSTCCHSWLALPSFTSKAGYETYCNSNPLHQQTIKVSKDEKVTIRFHQDTSQVMESDGFEKPSGAPKPINNGFLLQYSIFPILDSANNSQSLLFQEKCGFDMFQCNSGECIPSIFQCDYVKNCNDNSDEMNCNMECYGKNQVPCGPLQEDGCFDNATQRCNGVFDCPSKRDESDCHYSQSSCGLRCSNLACFSFAQRCDRKPDCADYSDEFNCKFCEPGKVLCNADPGMNECFNPTTQKCDGIPHCPFGEDEIGCFPECNQSIRCASGKKCYFKSQRCDSIKDCTDNSDEYNCPNSPVKCDVGKRICDNGNCIPSQLWCNGIDDCGDESDETTCFRNTLIAAAVMGVLLCGLLLIIAVACTCRLYSLRLSHARFHVSPHLTSRLRLNQSGTLPPLIDDEFFHREPPPAYSVAIGDYPPPILQPLQPMPPRQLSHGRRIRRLGSNRRYSRTYGVRQHIRQNYPVSEASSSLIVTRNEPIINNSANCDKPPENSERVDLSSNSSSNSSPAHGSTNLSSSSTNPTESTVLLPS